MNWPSWAQRSTVKAWAKQLVLLDGVGSTPSNDKMTNPKSWTEKEYHLIWLDALRASFLLNAFLGFGFAEFLLPDAGSSGRRLSVRWLVRIRFTVEAYNAVGVCLSFAQLTEVFDFFWRIEFQKNKMDSVRVVCVEAFRCRAMLSCSVLDNWDSPKVQRVKVFRSRLQVERVWKMMIWEEWWEDEKFFWKKLEESFPLDEEMRKEIQTNSKHRVPCSQEELTTELAQRGQSEKKRVKEAEAGKVVKKKYYI